MEQKKYILKTDNDQIQKSADGTENSEHVFDMLARAEMCLSNIQDNTDLCMSMYKLNQNGDEDEKDALQLFCEDCIEIECQAGQIGEEIEMLKYKIDKHLKIDLAKVEQLLKDILILELRSKEIVEKMLK